MSCCNVIATHVCCIAQPPTDPPSPTRASVYGLTEMATIQHQTTHTPMDLTTPILIINFIVLYIWKCYSIMCELLQCDCNICMLYCTITHSIAILLRYSLRSPLQRYSVMIITCGGRSTHYLHKAEYVHTYSTYIPSPYTCVETVDLLPAVVETYSTIDWTLIAY